MKNPWKCKKCGSTDLDQEWSFMAPMNDEGDEDQIMGGAQQVDFYWCNECDEDCTPIRDEK